MAGAKVKVIKDRRRKFTDAVRRVVIRRLAKVGELVRSEVVRVLSQHSSRGAGPSPIGGPPGIDEGTLRKSVNYSVDERKLEVSIGSPLVYAAHEFWGRPYLQPTAFRLQPLAQRILTAKISDAELGKP
jgi:hypothetical protein